MDTLGQSPNPHLTDCVLYSVGSSFQKSNCNETLFLNTSFYQRTVKEAGTAVITDVVFKSIKLHTLVNRGESNQAKQGTLLVTTESYSS